MKDRQKDTGNTDTIFLSNALPVTVTGSIWQEVSVCDTGNGWVTLFHEVEDTFTPELHVTNLMLTQVIQVRRLGSQAPSYLNYLCQH